MNEIVTKEEVKKFQEIALKDYGKKLTYKQAYEQGSKLVLLFETVIRKKLDNGN